MLDCLSSCELDRLFAPRSAAWLSSVLLHDVANQHVDAASARSVIDHTVAAHGYALAAAHTRHHWALAIFTTGPNPRTDKSMTIIDSAPSPPTHRDWLRLARKLGLTFTGVFSPFRQVRGSNECGIHVLRHALGYLHTLKTYGLSPHAALPTRQMPGPVVSLHAWRAILRAALPIGITDDVVAQLQRTDDGITAGAVDSDDSDDEVRIVDPPPRPAPVSRDTVSGLPMDAEGWQVFDQRDYTIENFVHRVRIVDSALLREAATDRSFVNAQLISAALWSMIPAVPSTVLMDSDYARALVNEDNDAAIRSLRGALTRQPPPTDIVTIVHHGEHYTTLHVSLREPIVNVYDSLAPASGRPRAADIRTSAAISQAVGWQLRPVARPCPQQERGSNECAFFAMRRAAEACGFQRHHISRQCPEHVTARWFDRKPENEGAQPVVPVRSDPTPTPETPPTSEPTVIEWELPESEPVVIEWELPVDSDGFLPPAPGAPIAHTQVRAITRSFDVGQVVFVHAAYGGTLQRWCGTITTAATKRAPASITYQAYICDCGLVHPLIDDEDTFKTPWDLPFKGVTYRAVAPLDAMPEMAPPCVDDDDISDDDDDLPAAAPPARGTATSAATGDASSLPVDHAADMCALGSAPVASASALTGKFAFSWFIHHTRPDHVHKATWARVSEETRRGHIRWLLRIRAMSPEAARMPFARACVEVVMRWASARAGKSWKWSSVSSALSAVASAAFALPLYTNHEHGVNLRQDAYFAETMASAAKKARITATEPQKSAPMSHDKFKQLAAQISHSGTRALLVFSWWLYARVGDARKLLPENITFGEVSELGTHVSALFVEGKMASIWGPYTVQTVMPTAEAKRVQELTRTRPQGHHLFTKADQTTLSAIVNKDATLSLRSIRRGALVHFSAHGVSDHHLMLASGHKKRETLQRYLSWGHHCGEARDAAHARARAVHGGESAPHHPMRVGQHSGFIGRSGRRVIEPPRLFPLKAPSARDLGIEDTVAEDQSQWPLALKDVTPLHWPSLINMTLDHQLKEALLRAQQWLTSPDFYNVTWAALAPSQVPLSKFNEEQVAAMIAKDKLKPLDPNEPILAAARGFPAAQPRKKTFRPVFETLYNKGIRKEELPSLAYPSRLERRQQLFNKTYFLEFDMKGYYDALTLAEVMHKYHVVRMSTPSALPDGRMTHLYALTREPMGSAHSAHVAQTCTWALAEPILSDPKVAVATMIDNVGIGSNDRFAFLRAVRTFVARCAEANVLLNEHMVQPHTSDADILAAARRAAAGPTVFLGERFGQGMVSNSEANIDKLRRAYERMQAATDPSHTVTRRQVASVIGLTTWLAHTINVPLARHFKMLRLFAELEGQADRWDHQANVNPFMLNVIGEAIGPILRNIPVAVDTLPPPGRTHGDYDITVILDASATGWAAIVCRGNDTTVVRSGWTRTMQHSAWAEPSAVVEALKWVRAHCPAPSGRRRRIAIVTDHRAIVLGQRKHWSRHGGASTAFYLNSAFEAAYDDAYDDVVDFFYVPGPRNIADRDSRSCVIGEGRRYRPYTGLIPSLDTFEPPPQPRPRRWYQV